MSTSTEASASARGRDGALNEIIAATGVAVADDVDNAAVVFRAEGESVRQVATDIRIGGHRITVDEPATLGGEDTDPNPVETALAGLLSCQVVTYRFWAARLGIPLERIRVEAEGDLDVRGFFGLDDAVRPGFGEVRVKVTLDGPASPQRYRELRETVDRHCPVLDLFSNPTPVRTNLVLGGRRPRGVRRADRFRVRRRSRRSSAVSCTMSAVRSRRGAACTGKQR